jgi:hypothetical protein
VILAGRCDIFSLSKRGKPYYARFWSEVEQRHTVTRATGATNKAQAGRSAEYAARLKNCSESKRLRLSKTTRGLLHRLQD